MYEGIQIINKIELNKIIDECAEEWKVAGGLMMNIKII